MDVLRKKIDELLMQKDIVIVAIDGKCTSGKTTLAAKLAEIYDCNVFHMDDFFLRP
jgi:uridine kinase